MSWHDGVRRLTHEEFVSWKSAKGLLFGGVEFSDRLIQMLKSGQVEAAANAKWMNGAAHLSTGYVAITPTWWLGVDGGHPIHFANLWKTGQISLFVPDLVVGAISQVHFDSVRFQPEHLAAALDPATPIQSPVVTQAPAPPKPPPAPTPSIANYRSAGPPPPPAETSNVISEADFRSWLEPSAVMEMLPAKLGRDGCRTAIMSRMRHGLIRTAAARKVDGAEPKRRVELEVALWETWGYLANDTASELFWNAGEREIHRSGGRPVLGLYGIRLDPAGVEEMLLEIGNGKPPSAAPSLDNPRAQKKTKATEQDVRTWYRANAASLEPLSFGGVKSVADTYFNARGTQTPRNALRRVIGEFGHTKAEGKQLPD